MGAADLLQHVRAAGFRLDVDGDKLVIRPASKLTDDLRVKLRAAKPELMALLSRPYRLSVADADAAHAEPWDEPAVGRFVARVSLFIRRGINATDADDLAERLHLRDLHAADQRLVSRVRVHSRDRCYRLALR